MKIFGLHYDDYINKCSILKPHFKINKLLNQMPDDITLLKNIIFYGSPNIGKYTEALMFIKNYSPSKLKYEKKISVVFNKENYYFKISDIHYEIDFSLLGCNSKLLWHEIFQQITDIIYSKPNKKGIILCKYFNEIQPELLEIFYSYMQKDKFSLIEIKFIILTEHISFIPENILNCCDIITFSKPSKKIINDYKKDKIMFFNEIEKNNLNIFNVVNNEINHYNSVCNKILNDIINIETLNFLKFRDDIYEIFIYNLDINNCIWIILNHINEKYNISVEDMSKVMIKTFQFLKFYQNNYRPISHAESYFLFLLKIIHRI